MSEEETTPKRRISINWKRYGMEFLSVFVAVISAFALNNWNDNRKSDNSENKILTEISNGLHKDLLDINNNINGHKLGIVGCKYFQNVFTDKEVNPDSIMFYYRILTRDFINLQNIAGYETLKSQGLELVKNDSLRGDIISLYEYDYTILRKMEEEYSEMQFHDTYFNEINDVLAPHFQLDENQNLAGLQYPLQIEDPQRKKMLLFLWKIESNREFILKFYTQVEARIMEVRNSISHELNA